MGISQEKTRVLRVNEEYVLLEENEVGAHSVGESEFE